MGEAQELTPVTFGVTQKGRQKLIDVEGNAYKYNSKSRDGSTTYWICVHTTRCTGRFKYFVKKNCGYVTMPHIPEENNSFEKLKNRALDRLQELTMSITGNVKAIELVRSVLKDLQPEVRQLMPREDCLLNKVRKWAKTNNIELVKETRTDYMIQEGEEPLAGFAGIGNPTELEAAMATNLDEGGSKFRVKTGVVYMEPVECPSERKPTGMIIFKDKTDGRLRAVIEGQTFFWNEDLGDSKQVFICQESMNGCSVVVSVDQLLKRYEMKGVHRHARIKLDKRNGRNLLKRVDENGLEIGQATLSEVSTMGWSRNQATEDLNLLQSTPDNEMQHDGECDFDNDFGDDCEPEAPEPDRFPDRHPRLDHKPQTISHTVSTSSMTGQTCSPLKPKMAKKTGERCFVCGDHLIVSEAVTSSEQIFQKACCYLNVRSKSDGFPKGKDSRHYSFCESCTKEIIKISDLYKKVEEMQSLIFKKVENVEKRIADAEILDNWMAQAPPTTATRYEGFRKQVMINYRNKLMVRREVRHGRKTGHSLLEIQPTSTAQMYAKDPAETIAFRRGPIDDLIPEKPGGRHSKDELPDGRKNKPMPKSKKIQQQNQEESSLATEIDANDIAGSNFNDGYDDMLDDIDRESLGSEKEAKFWESDPSQLNVSQAGMDCDTNDSNSDLDTNDPEWESSTQKKPKFSASTRSSEHSAPRKLIFESKKRPKKAVIKKPTTNAVKESGCKYFKFPDAVLTNDGKVFMEGVEIIKNPPGRYKTRPYSPSFSCGACGMVFLAFWRTRQHICGHHLGMFRCNLCQKQYSDIAGFDRHMVIIHGKGNHKICEVCQKPVSTYRNSRAMSFHRWSHLGDEEKKDPQYEKWRPPHLKKKISQKRQGYMCDYCGKTFLVLGYLKNHELTHQHDQEQQKPMCQDCGKVYKHKEALKRHYTWCSGKEPSKRRRFPCPKCTTVCGSHVALYTHKKRFHSTVTNQDLPFSCPKCPKCFSTRSAFQSHKRVCKEAEKGNNKGKKQQTQIQSWADSNEESQHDYETSTPHLSTSNRNDEDGGAVATNITYNYHHFLTGNYS